MKSLNIIHLYPDLLNLYGDKGNIAVLRKRCILRGIEANVIEIKENDTFSLKDADIVLLGGGSDKEQITVSKKLYQHKEEFLEYRDSMGVLLALCGSYELLGRYFTIKGEKIDGLSLCDQYSEDSEKRLISNIAIQTQNGVVVGFSNHSGRTYIGENSSPFGTVIRGKGNNDEDKNEGTVYKNIIGTYLHGPLLPKNPEIADLMIKRALERKYGEKTELSELEDEIAKLAKAYVLDITKEG